MSNKKCSTSKNNHTTITLWMFSLKKNLTTRLTNLYFQLPNEFYKIK